MAKSISYSLSPIESNALFVQLSSVFPPVPSVVRMAIWLPVLL